VLYDLIPESMSTAGFSLNDLIESSSVQVYSLVVGLILSGLAGATLLGFDGLQFFKILFALSAVACVLVVVQATATGNRAEPHT